jgi:hypothetical protein
MDAPPRVPAMGVVVEVSGTKRYGVVFLAVLIVALALAVPAAADPLVVIDNSSATAIADNLTRVDDGGTLILNPGLYREYGIIVGKSVTIRVADGYGPSDITIDGMKGGASILSIVSGNTIVLDNLTIFNGSAHDGGGVYNSGTLFVNSTVFRNCSAVGGTGGPKGGAIFNLGTLVITSGTFTGCSAYDGGAIANAGSTTITSSTFSECSAYNGGAIFNGSLITSITSSTFTKCSATAGGAIFNNLLIDSITSSTFTKCSATAGGAIYDSPDSLAIYSITSSTFSECSAGWGGAIYTDLYVSLVRFCRFFGNSASFGPAIARGIPTPATDNWWGTNSNPAGMLYGVYGGLTPSEYTPWLVLGATASPVSVSPGETVQIRANLTFDTTPANTAGGGIFVPDGIPVSYSFSGVSGSLDLSQGNITTGANSTTFRPVTTGTATVYVQVDNEIVPVTILVTQGPPVITGITPASGVNTSSMSVTNLAGSSFMLPGTTTVNLTRAGYANITATGVTVTSPSRITCTLPITGAEAGAWDVVVINPDGREGVLPNGFTVTAPAPTTVPTTVPTTPPTTVPTTAPTTSPASAGIPPAGDPGSSGSDDDYWGTNSPLPLMTVTVNIGGDARAYQATVTGTRLADLVITGTGLDSTTGNRTPLPGTVFAFFRLEPAAYGSITHATINFSVPQSWMDGNHFAPGSIVLYHLTAAGNWAALPTTVLYAKDGTVYFSAESDGFSLFAIAGTPAAATPAVRTVGTSRSTVQEQVTARAIGAKAPVTTQTTVPPAPVQQPAGFPFLTAALIGAGCIILTGSGWYVRRWWIRRQNPALFMEYD